MNISYHEVKPGPALQPYVECFWFYSFNSGHAADVSPVQRCLPFGMVEIIAHLDNSVCEAYFDGEWRKLPQIFLAGMYHEPVFIRSGSGTRKFGVRLKPETFHLFFKVPPTVVYSDYTVLQNIIGNEASLLAERLSEAAGLKEIVAHTEAFLLAQLRRHREEHDYVIEAAKLMRQASGYISIEEVSKLVYVSIRQLQRGFREKIGTSPKTYLRISRFRNAYRQIEQLQERGSWAGLSYNLGYADQAHFIREFKAFSGTSPAIMLHSNTQVHGLGEERVKTGA